MQLGMQAATGFFISRKTLLQARLKLIVTGKNLPVTLEAGL
jgi:hypothetical protein